MEVDEKNIIEGPRTRSKAVCILETIRKVTLKYKLALSCAFKGYRSYQQALKTDNRWKVAYEKEIRKLEEFGRLKVRKKEEHMKPIPFIEVLTEKEDNVTGEKSLKVRLAVRGDLQEDRPSNVHSPAAGTSEMRMFVAIMKGEGYYVKQGDCPSAYLNGELDENVILKLPSGHPQKDDRDTYVYCCPSSIYGLAVAGRVWYHHFRKKLDSFTYI